VLFAHPVNVMEGLGISLVFAALGGQIVHKWLSRKPKPKEPVHDVPSADELETSASLKSINETEAPRPQDRLLQQA